MFTKKIKYSDYFGNEREEEFNFHLNKAELIEMQLSTEGGLEKKVNKIINTKDHTQIIAIFKDLILRSYGEISDDGKRFVKSKELSDAFSQTEAYSTLFLELASDAKIAADFVNGIIPADVRDQLPKNAIPEA